MTHEDLRKAAVKWLTNTKGCSVILSEMDSLASEIPDAIGFQAHQSILVECKVSRADFFRNDGKQHVANGNGVGQYRYFLTPPNMVTSLEVPDPYGLLVVLDGRIAIKKAALLCQDANLLNERTMLISALRRVKTRAFLTLNTCECCPESAEETKKESTAA